jgi:hypothetical protein
MDPYLEEAWHDVHNSLCTYSRDDIQSQLSGGLIARVDERLVVEQSSGIGRSIHGDVRIVHRNRPTSPPAIAPSSTAVALAEPITLELSDEMATEGFIEIIDTRTGGKVITVIEFVSMTNKLPGPGQDQYRRKRLELETGGVSLVEINLLRSGPFIETFPQAMLHPENRTPYYVIVHRGWAKQTYQYYPMALAERLSAIAIPLRETDADVVLDIQSLIDRVYRNGAYDIEIDYASNPNPPLEGRAAEWADALLKEAGAR